MVRNVFFTNSIDTRDSWYIAVQHEVEQRITAVNLEYCSDFKQASYWASSFSSSDIDKHRVQCVNYPFHKSKETGSCIYCIVILQMFANDWGPFKRLLQCVLLSLTTKILNIMVNSFHYVGQSCMVLIAEELGCFMRESWGCPRGTLEHMGKCIKSAN